jgi:hypothetical protein
VFLSHVTHQLHPTYSLLKKQCFLFAAVIFAAVLVDVNWGEDKKEDRASDLAAAHKSNNFGHYNGYKVQWVDPWTVSSLISKYKEVHSQKLANVLLFIYDHSDYH